MLYCDDLELWGHVTKLQGVTGVHKIVPKSGVHFVGEEGTQARL